MQEGNEEEGIELRVKLSECSAEELIREVVERGTTIIVAYAEGGGGHAFVHGDIGQVDDLMAGLRQTVQSWREKRTKDDIVEKNSRLLLPPGVSTGRGLIIN